MKTFILVALLLTGAHAQANSGSSGNNGNAGSGNGDSNRFEGVDPDLIVNPPEGLDLEGCFSDLIKSDIDGSGAIEKDEYLNFINTYGERICWYQEELTLEQHGAFNSLACICRSQEGNDASCCLLDNAKLPTTNAMNPQARTEEQLLFLTVACVVTDGTLEHLCTPYVIERETLPPVFIDPASRGIALNTNPEDGSIWAIIMGLIGLLLLVCLCCCCCAAGTRNKSREEEEQDEDVQVIPPITKQEPMEQAPRELDMEEVYQEVPPPVVTEEEIIEEEEVEKVPGGDEVEEVEEIEEIQQGDGNANRGVNEAEDEDEGEGNRKRGSNYVDEEDDDGIPRWGGPRLPPPEDPEPDPLKLKPIPDKVPEDPPEWDQPGREILEPKYKDEMEGQTFEPYLPDGGVQRDDREGKEPLDWRKDWNRPKPPEADESDNRKHRIQSGLGEGEVWDKLNEGDDQSKSLVSGGTDVFDWVVQSALGVLDKADDGQSESENQESRTDNV